MLNIQRCSSLLFEQTDAKSLGYNAVTPSRHQEVQILLHEKSSKKSIVSIALDKMYRVAHWALLPPFIAGIGFLLVEAILSPLSFFVKIGVVALLLVVTYVFIRIVCATEKHHKQIEQHKTEMKRLKQEERELEKEERLQQRKLRSVVKEWKSQIVRTESICNELQNRCEDSEFDKLEVLQKVSKRLGEINALIDNFNVDDFNDAAFLAFSREFHKIQTDLLEMLN
jgi:hypothetical protein